MESFRVDIIHFLTFTNLMSLHYVKAARFNTLTDSRTNQCDEKSRWLCSLPIFGARLSVALASELSQFGTCVKTLTRAWVGGW